MLLAQDLIKKHSEFISYPISLWTEKTTEKEVDDDEEAEESSAPKEEEEEGKIEEVLLLHANSSLSAWQSCRPSVVCRPLRWPVQHICCVTHRGGQMPTGLHDAAVTYWLWCMQYVGPERTSVRWWP